MGLYTAWATKDPQTILTKRCTSYTYTKEILRVLDLNPGRQTDRFKDLPKDLPSILLITEAL